MSPPAWLRRTAFIPLTAAYLLVSACNPPSQDAGGHTAAVPYWQPALAMMSLGLPAPAGSGDLRALTAAAQAGDPTAMNDLGRELLIDAHRQPGAPDWAHLGEAQMWWNRAAALGDSSAMILLGHMYAEGWGVPVGRDLAAQWLKKAADQGRRDARLDLARLYLGEWSYDSDMPQAIAWLEQAADRSQDEGAMIELGLIYDAGLGVRADPGKAAQWYERALDQRAHDENGDASPELAVAANNLGLLYEAGRGVSRNTDRARQLLAQADEQRPLAPGEVRMRAGLWQFQVDLIYADPASGVRYRVERDGRHLAAVDKKGRVLWRRDPFADAKLHPYRISYPRILAVGPAPAAAGPQLAGHQGLEVDYNSTQALLIDLTTGTITSLGQA